MDVWPAGLFPDRWVGDTAKDALLTHASNSGPKASRSGLPCLPTPSIHSAIVVSRSKGVCGV